MSKYRANRALEQSIKSNIGRVGSPFNSVSTIFNGVDERAEADALQVAMVGQTVGAWTFRMKLTDGGSFNNMSPFLLGGSGVTLFGFAFTPNDGKLIFNALIGGSFKYALDSQAGLINHTNWGHVGVTHDGVTAKLYYNGIPTTQVFRNVTDKTAWVSAGDGFIDNARIGNRKFNGSESGFFGGQVDELRIWNKFKSDAQILADHNNGVSIEPDLDGLITPYRMGDGDTHPTLLDSISGNNATMINMSPASFLNDVSK